MLGLTRNLHESANYERSKLSWATVQSYNNGPLVTLCTFPAAKLAQNTRNLGMERVFVVRGHTHWERLTGTPEIIKSCPTLLTGTSNLLIKNQILLLRSRLNLLHWLHSLKSIFLLELSLEETSVKVRQIIREAAKWELDNGAHLPSLLFLLLQIKNLSNYIVWNMKMSIGTCDV